MLANYHNGKQVKERKTSLQSKNAMSYGFFFSCKGNSLTMHNTLKKKTTGRITIAINKISAEFLCET